MKPYTRSIFDLFDGKRRYEVPLFQRQYVWNKEDHWKPLWEDIERKFIQRLKGETSTPHFLGAMVLDHHRSFGNSVPVHLVIDGQQRLTTFQIFLAAYRDVCAAEGQKDHADECARYLLNTGIMHDPKVERFKLWPTNLDRKQFADAIDAGSVAGINNLYPVAKQKNRRQPDPRPKMIECYLYFYGELLEFLKSEEHGESVPGRVAVMHEALRGALQVVTVELENGDDPQVIFETLNARGEPLLPSDLLRNSIFLRAAQKGESQEALYREFWSPFDEEFWREPEKQGRLLRPRSDLFLQHYLTLQRRQEVLIARLYTEYKDWIGTEKPFQTVKAELESLSKHRDFYRKLAQPDPETAIGRFSAFLRIFDLSTVYPLVLGMMSANLPDDELAGMLKDIESYILRRAVCGLGTKNYNRFFLAVLVKLSKTEFSRSNLRSVFLEQRGESSIWPNDVAFRKAWLTNPAYEDLGTLRVQYILREIEYALHQSRTERIRIDSTLTVEHILPDGWLDHWPLPSGHHGVADIDQSNNSRSVEDIEATQMRDLAKHTLGNLTLLTQPLNSSVSNAGFATKKLEILKNSALTLNRYFLDKVGWDETSITARGEALFAHAKNGWPHPEGGHEVSTQEDGTAVFSSEVATPSPPVAMEVFRMEDQLDYISNASMKSNAAALLAEVKTWHPMNIAVDAIKEAISLKVNNRVFAYIKPRREYFVISTYSADDEWGDHPVRNEDDLRQVKILVRAAMDRRSE